MRRSSFCLTFALIASTACSGEPSGDLAGGEAGKSALAGTAGASAVGGASTLPQAGSSGGRSGGSGGAPASGGAPSSGGATESGNGGGGASGGGAGSSAGSAGSTAQAGGSGAAGSAGAAGAGDAFSPCPSKAGSACAVLPLGDSITEGFGSSGGGYRVELFRQAVQNGKHLTFVGALQNGPTTVQDQPFPRRHEGHGGFAIDPGNGHSGISGAITAQAIASYQPQIVLLMIGTNDINGNFDVSAAPARLGKLIDDITTRAPNALVVVATIIPVGNDGTNQKVKSYNAAIPGLVSARASAGKHVRLIDNYAAFSKDPNYRTALMSDSLHPNDAGYVVLGRAFYGALEAVLR